MDGLALDRHGAITVVRRNGTVPDGGGDFESEYLYPYLVHEACTRIETFEMSALDLALARLEELRPGAPGREIAGRRAGRGNADPV